MRREIIILIAVLFMISLSNIAQAIGGGGGNWNDHYPSMPPCAWCTINGSTTSWYYEGNNPIFSDPIPSWHWWSDYATITSKGVQTCINVTVPAGCSLNVTFQWFNITYFFDLWITWRDAQDWSDWWEHVNWSTEPDSNNDSFWHNYSSWIGLVASQKLCAYNENVTCSTENDYISQIQYWRATAELVCAGYTTNTTCTYCFAPERCPISYIWPPSPNGTACPCCEAMCIRISNEQGHAMNLTIFRNDTMNETFYPVNRYVMVSNGTYCFCLDGHMDDIYYPMRYNTTYHWYVNITDTVTGTASNSSIFQFRTVENLSLCPCGLEALEDIIEDEDRYRNDAWLIGVIIVFFVAAMVIGKRRRVI